MLDLTTSSLLVETKYAARKSTTPILSITKVGSAFNVAFCETYILPGKSYKKNATFYTQLVKQNDKYFVLLSEDNLASFYVSTLNVESKTIHISAKGFRDILGAEGKTVRYKVKEEKTNNPKVRAFELTPFVADEVKSNKLPADFQIG